MAEQKIKIAIETKDDGKAVLSLQNIGEGAKRLSNVLSGTSKNIAGISQKLGQIAEPAARLKNVLGGTSTNIANVSRNFGEMGKKVAPLSQSLEIMNTAAATVLTNFGSLGTASSALISTMGGLMTSLTGIQKELVGMTQGFKSSTTAVSASDVAMKNNSSTVRTLKAEIKALKEEIKSYTDVAKTASKTPIVAETTYKKAKPLSGAAAKAFETKTVNELLTAPMQATKISPHLMGLSTEMKDFEKLIWNVGTGYVKTQDEMTQKAISESKKRMGIATQETNHAIRSYNTMREYRKTNVYSSFGVSGSGTDMEALQQSWKQQTGRFSKWFGSEQSNWVIGKGFTDEGEAISKTTEKLKNYNDEVRRGLKDKKDFVANLGFTAMKVIRLMVAYAALRESIRLLTYEVSLAFTATEQYKQSVIEMSALMTSFADMQPGQDIGAIYMQATDFAKELVKQMEILDIQTIASAEDLKTMVQSFMMGGIQIDVNNKKVLEGFRDLANAMKILLANYPNQTAQIAQEIRSLLNGQARATDTLGRIMQAQLGDGWAKILKKWKAAGPDVFIQKIAEQFKGMGTAAKEMEGLWSTLTSSFKTIHTILFREAFGGFHQMVLDTFKGMTTAFRDESGKLTDLGRATGRTLIEIWLEVKDAILNAVMMFKLLWEVIGPIINLLWEMRDVIKLIVGTWMVMWVTESLKLLSVFKALAAANIATTLAAAGTAARNLFNAFKANAVLIGIGLITSAIVLLIEKLREAKKSVEELQESYKFMNLAELDREKKKLGWEDPNVTTQLWDENTLKSTAEILKEIENRSISIIKARKANQDTSILEQERELLKAKYRELELTKQIAIEQSKAKPNFDEIESDQKKLEAARKAQSLMMLNYDNKRLEAIRRQEVEIYKEIYGKTDPVKLKMPEGADDDKGAKKRLTELYDKLAALKARTTDQLSDLKEAMQTQFSELDSMISQGLLSTPDAISQKVTIAIDTAEKGIELFKNKVSGEISQAEPIWKELFALEDPAIAKDKFKTWAIDRMKDVIKINEDESQTIKKQEEYLYEYIRKLDEKRIEHYESMGSDRLAALKELQQGEISITRDTTNWMLETRRIGAQDAYEIEKNLLSKELDLQIEYLNETKNIQELALRQKLSRTMDISEIESLYQQIESLDKSTRDAILQARQSFLSKRISQEQQAADNIEMIWDTSGAAGVMLKGIVDLQREWSQVWNDIYEGTKQVFEDLASAYSDILYDGITGKLDDLSDYFEKVWQSMLRTMTDILGKMATEAAQGIVVPIVQQFTGATGNQQGNTGIFNFGMKKLFGGVEDSVETSVGVLNGTSTEIVDEIGDMSTELGELNANMSLISGATAKVTGSQTAATGAGAMSYVGAGVMGAVGGYGLGGQFYPSYKGAKVGGAIGGAAGALGGYALGTSMVASGFAGMKAGAGIGSIVPGLGTVIGMAIGALVGSFLGKVIGGKPSTPKVAMNYQPEVGFTMKSWHAGMTREDKEPLEKQFAWIRETLKQTATSMGGEIKALDQFWNTERRKFDDEKEFLQAMGGMARDYLKDMTGVDIKEFQKDGEKLWETAVRVVQAWRDMARLQENLALFIENIDDLDDPLYKLNTALASFDTTISDIKLAMETIEDPSDALEAAQTLSTALIERYTTEIEWVNDLVDAIDNMEKEFTDFLTNINDKIIELGGTPEGFGDVISYYKTKGLEMAGNLMNPEIPIEDKYDDFQSFLNYLDSWYEASKTQIEQEFEAKIQVHEDIIDALEDEQDAIDAQIDALEEQVDLIEDWKDILEDVNDMINDLKITSSNPEDVFARVDYARNQVLSAQDRYRGATTEADQVKYAKEYYDAMQDYIDIAQEAYQRPSSEYRAIYGEVLGWLEEIKGQAEVGAKSTEDLLDEIATLEKESAAIDKQIEQHQAEIATLTKEMNADIDALNREARDYYTWAQTVGKDIYTGKIDSLNQTLRSVIGPDGDVKTYISNLQTALKGELEDINEWLQKYLPTTVEDNTNGGGGGAANLSYVSESISRAILDAAKAWADAGAPGSGQKSDYEQLLAAFNQYGGKLPTSWAEPWAKAFGIDLNTAATPSQAASPWVNIKTLAEGGIVTKPTLAMIGEGGEPEWIVPQSKTGEFVEKMQKGSSSGGNYTVSVAPVINITTNGEVDEATIAKTVSREIERSFKYYKGRELVKRIK